MSRKNANKIPAESASMPLPNATFMDRFETQELLQRDELAKAGLLIELGQLADEMQVQQQSISRAVKEQRIFSLHGASGQLLYPAFFAAQELDRRQVQKVSRALGDLPGASKWQFFITPKVSLKGKTALEALENGDLESVLIAAAGFLES